MAGGGLRGYPGGVDLTREGLSQADVARRLAELEKMAALGRLSAGVVHEVNNPLAVILGLVQILMRRADTSPEALSDLLKLDAEVRRIQKLVQGMLGYARGAKPAMAPIDAALVAEDTLELAAPELKRRRVRAALETEPDLPAVLADAAGVKQVLLNLLLNAAHAMADTGGRLWLDVRRRDRRLELSVADEGPGVPEALRGRLFEAFVTSKPQGEGTGLGLFVSAQIVRAHGGVLRHEPREGGGAVFSFDLPLVAP